MRTPADLADRACMVIVSGLPGIVSVNHASVDPNRSASLLRQEEKRCAMSDGPSQRLRPFEADLLLTKPINWNKCVLCSFT